MSKQRLEYIDLAKGIGIISIIALHIGALPTWMPKLSASWVPLFFILSGMFFRPEESFRVMLIKKINTILIPFMFFYVASYIVFYMAELLIPGLMKSDAKGIGDVFRQENYFNGPIWFLLSLFWDFLILWGIFRCTNNHVFRSILIFAIGIIGIALGMSRVFLPLKIAQAFTALLFFYIGYIIKSNYIFGYFNRLKSCYMSIGLFLVSVLLARMFAPSHMEPSLNLFVGNILISYLIILSFSFATIFISKTIYKIDIINYFGKYSLIPLCLHHLIYRPIQLFCNMSSSLVLNSKLSITILIILIILILMPLIIKYCPYICGQKNLIKIR